MKEECNGGMRDKSRVVVKYHDFQSVVVGKAGDQPFECQHGGLLRDHDKPENQFRYFLALVLESAGMIVNMGNMGRFQVYDAS